MTTPVPKPHYPDPVKAAISDTWTHFIQAAKRLGVPLAPGAEFTEQPPPEFEAGCVAALEKLKA